MAKYTSRYKELTFYVGSERKKFANGVFSTDDKDAIAVLDTLRDVIKAEEPKPAAKPKAEDTPADKPAKAKPTAKK